MKIRTRSRVRDLQKPDTKNRGVLKPTVGVSVALLCAVLLPSPAVSARSTTNPAVITALAAEAYVWGLGPEYIHRFSKYNTIIGAPFNAFKYGSVPAAWNNAQSLTCRYHAYENPGI